MPARQKDVRWKTYQDYLNSPTWKKKAKRAREIAKYRCKVCNSSGLLEVHHRCYPAKWGEEPLSDLLPLCEDCHSLFSEKLVPKNRGKEGAPLLTLQIREDCKVVLLAKGTRIVKELTPNVEGFRNFLVTASTVPKVPPGGEIPALWIAPDPLIVRNPGFEEVPLEVECA